MSIGCLTTFSEETPASGSVEVLEIATNYDDDLKPVGSLLITRFDYVENDEGDVKSKCEATTVCIHTPVELTKAFRANNGYLIVSEKYKKTGHDSCREITILPEHNDMSWLPKATK